MPAMIDDPASPAIFRRSGAAPYPQPGDPLPSSIQPRSLVLRDRTTKATLIPFSAPSQVPLSLLDYLRQQLNREIEKGDTYPMIDNFTFEAFGPYWFQNFGAVMLLGDIAGGADEVRRMEEQEGGVNWEKQCLGSFYIKPNYPGRSSHVCNGGFLVTDGARNRGVGRLMGECYLEWAPLLGYTYSVFNLVYETNVASCRIWDALGFKRIGRVPGCGNLATQPEGHFVDAIIYGRHLGYKKEDADDERRFERIKYYLKTGKYPGDADSAEKNRLRAAVRNYTLVESGGGKNGTTGVDGGDGSGDGSGGGGGGGNGGGDGISGGGDKLMLGDKEVISEPRMQYEIARRYHRQNKDTHAGINKTTATVSEKYHWNRIKTTVTEVIENCTECNEKLKKKSLKAAAAAAANSNNHGGGGGGNGGARKISGGEMSAGIANASSLSQSSSSENLLLASSASSAPTPTPAVPPPEFVFQHEFAVVDGSSAAGSAAATPRASPSVSEMHYGDDMALDPHNIAMLSSAVQNLGSSVDGVGGSGGGGPSSSSVGGPHQPFQSPPLHQSSFGESFSDPYHHHHPDGLATSIDPASLQQYHHHHHDQHPVTHQQYLSPYQPLADGAGHFGSPSGHHLGQGFLDQDGVIIDGDSSDTQQQPFGAS